MSQDVFWIERFEEFSGVLELVLRVFDTRFNKGFNRGELGFLSIFGGVEIVA